MLNMLDTLMLSKYFKPFTAATAIKWFDVIHQENCLFSNVLSHSNAIASRKSYIARQSARKLELHAMDSSV